jgi:hypothetical protein
MKKNGHILPNLLVTLPKAFKKWHNTEYFLSPVVRRRPRGGRLQCLQQLAAVLQQGGSVKWHLHLRSFFVTLSLTGVYFT